MLILTLLNMLVAVTVALPALVEELLELEGFRCKFEATTLRGVPCL